MTGNNLPTPLDPMLDLMPYQPGMSSEEFRRAYNIQGDIIKLASNENPYGPSPKVIEVIQATVKTDASLYPDNHNFAAAVAQEYAVDGNMVVIGNGSNDVIDIVARTYLSQGDEAISSQYAFIAYDIAVTICGATNVAVPAKNFGHDLPAMLRAITERTKVIWIANPNNPTGTFAPSSVLQEFLDQVPSNIIVVLDEAYSEYLDKEHRYNSVEWLQKYKNLIVIKTMSKIHGLAGLRLGFAITSTNIADYMNRVRQPFNGNILALRAGVAALSDSAYVAQSFQRNIDGLEQLKQGFDKLNFSYLPTYGNFITVQFDDAAAVNQALLKHGIIVRALAPYNMANHLRISVGTPEQNEQLLDVLKTILPR